MDREVYISTDLKIEFHTSSHLGAGHGNVAVNRVVKRGVDGRPYIPASALKGALRRSAEQVLKMLSVNDDSFNAHLQRKGAIVQRKPCEGADARLRCQSKSPCLVCNVFGNGWTGRRLLVEDANIDSSDQMYTLKQAAFKRIRAAYRKSIDNEKLSIDDVMQDVTMRPDIKLDRFAGMDHETITRAQIDRTKRSTMQGSLFTTEYTPVRYAFQARLEGQIPLTKIDDGIPPAELILLAAAIGFVDQIGGEASTGHGLCTVHLIPANDDEGGGIRAGEGEFYTYAELIKSLDDLLFL